MCEKLGMDDGATLNIMYNRIINPGLTYGKQLLKLIKEDGYINTHMELSKKNKEFSLSMIENMDSNKCRELQKYGDIALLGK